MLTSFPPYSCNNQSSIVSSISPCIGGKPLVRVNKIRTRVNDQSYESIESEIQQLHQTILYHEQQINLKKEKLYKLLLLQQEKQDKEVNRIKWKESTFDDYDKNERIISDNENETNHSKTCDNSLSTTSIAPTPPADNKSTIEHPIDNQHQDNIDKVNIDEQIQSLLLASGNMENPNNENTMITSETHHHHFQNMIIPKIALSNNCTKTKRKNVIPLSVRTIKVLNRPLSILAEHMLVQLIKKKQYKQIYHNSYGYIRIESTGQEIKMSSDSSGRPIKCSVMIHINHGKVCNKRK